VTVPILIVIIVKLLVPCSLLMRLKEVLRVTLFSVVSIMVLLRLTMEQPTVHMRVQVVLEYVVTIAMFTVVSWQTTVKELMQMMRHAKRRVQDLLMMVPVVMLMVIRYNVVFIMPVFLHHSMEMYTVLMQMKLVVAFVVPIVTTIVI
jgi:hypothetical protein